MNRDPIIEIKCEVCGKSKSVRKGEYNRGKGRMHKECHKKIRFKAR